MKVEKFFACMLCSIFSIAVFSQNFGGTPANIKWQQVNSNAARIIFPKGYDTVGERVSAVVDALQLWDAHALGNKRKKVNVVLHPFSNVPNAFVQLAPFESEFYLHQPFDALSNGALSWEDQLSVHEYRHVQQYNNFNVGLSKIAGIVFGENARALANAASVPDWFFEGDAVYNETFMSSEGRGRLPGFLDGYRQIFTDSLNYSYEQLRNGSYQNSIPNHYPLGYMLVAYGYEKYGSEFWKNVTHDAASFKPLFYPLQGAVKKYAGISFTQFTEDAFSFFKEKMKTINKQDTIHWLTTLKKNNPQNYLFPHTYDGGNMIVLKNSFTKIPAFISIDKDGIETFIAVNDIGYERYFSYNNGKIIFTFSQPDIRYANRDFTGIKLLDIHAGKSTIVARHSNYFTPDISHNGKKIIAVEMPQALVSNLTLMDLEGNIIKEYHKNEILFSYPKFSRDDQSIFVLTKNHAGKMGIDKIDIPTGKFETILPFAKRILGNPLVQGDTLLFTCAHDDIQETWMYNFQSKKIFKTGINGFIISQSTFLPNGNLVASIFTADGYRLATFQPVWNEINASDTLKGLYVQQPFHTTENEFLKNLPVREFKVEPYHKLTNPFHFHSWNPVIDPPEYSLNIYGQNILNTIQSTLFYKFNSNEKFHQIGISEIYGGWFVQPFFGASQTWHRSFQYNADTNFTWNEFNANVGLRLPLNLSGGKEYRRLAATVSYHYNQVDWTGIAKELITNYQAPYMQYSIGYSGSIQQARKQIYPRLAENIFIQYTHTTGNLKARQLYINSQLFLPGFFSTHSLVLNASLQNRDTLQNYFFSNKFEAARGYESYQFARNWKIGATYHFPVCYPDIGFKNIVYFLRIRGAVFFDYAQGGGIAKSNQYIFRSAGAEIYFDTKWWNQQPVTFGFRYSRLLDYKYTLQQPNQWAFIVPVNLFGR